MNKIIISLIFASLFIANAHASIYSKEAFTKILDAEMQKNTEEMRRLELLRTIAQSCREVIPFFQEQFIDCIAYPEDTNCAKEQKKLDKFTRACNRADAIYRKQLQDCQNYLQNKTS